MPEDQLFRELCKPEVMRAGWHLAQADSRDDFVVDPVGHADFASNLPDRLSHLIEEVESHRYRPRHVLEIDLPKSGLSARPGNVLPIEESSLLHAVAYVLAPHLDRKLDKAVYSYRLHPDWRRKVKKGESLFREVNVEVPFLKRKTIASISPFEAWYERWPEFESDAEHAVTEEGYTHLTKTDISAYFENIDLRLLEALIRSLLKREEGRIIELLFRILNGWTRISSAGTTIGRGIPQGCDVSSFLANLYLIPLDRALVKFARRHDAKWFRYVDDVKIFTRSQHDARAAVFIINDALRALHLTLQGSKTQLLTGKALRDELDTRDLDKVNEVFKIVQKIDCDKPEAKIEINAALKPLAPHVTKYTRGLPKSVLGLSGRDNRMFRRLMTVYGRCGHTRMRVAAVTALRELPDLRILRKSLAYLQQMPMRTHDQTVNDLLSLVEEGALPFPYQQALALEAIKDLHPAEPKRVASRVRRLIGVKRFWVVYHKSLEAIATYPYKADWCHGIAEHFLKDDHPLVRRAAICLLVRAPKHNVRKRLQELIHHPDYGVTRLALYFHRFVTEQQFAKDELARLSRGSTSPVSLVRSLPRFYAIASTEDPVVARQLNGAILKLPKIESVKMQWHLGQLLDLTGWAARS